MLPILPPPRPSLLLLGVASLLAALVGPARPPEAAAQGNTVDLQAWVCPPAVDAANPDPAYFAAACPEPAAGLAFVLTRDGRPSTRTTDAEGRVRPWAAVSGPFTLQGELPGGATAAVFCAGDGEFTPVAVADETIAGELAAGARLECRWYWVAAAGTPVPATATTTATPVAPTATATATLPVPFATSPVEFVWSTPQDGPGALNQPGFVTLDPFGRLWVSNSATSEFFIYDLDGDLLETWGSAGSGAGQFALSRPGFALGKVAFAPDGTFYVADGFNRRVQKFAPDRAFLLAWGDEGDGTGDGQLMLPIGVAVTADGTVLVSDYERSDVQRFDANGRFIEIIGGTGSGNGEFDRPGMPTAAPDGTFYVAEIGNNRIQHFDVQGRFLGQFGSPGDGDGEVNMPIEVALDGTGNLYVADQLNHRVQVFAPDGTYLTQWGSFGREPGQFDVVGAVAVNMDGTVYVVDWQNNRVQKFKLLPPLGPA